MSEQPTEFYTAHAARRAAERYGILKPDDLRAIIKGCIEGRGCLMGQTGDVASYLYRHGDQRVAVLIDQKKRLMITALPPDSFDAAKMRKWRSKTKKQINRGESASWRKARNEGPLLE